MEDNKAIDVETKEEKPKTEKPKRTRMTKKTMVALETLFKAAEDKEEECIRIRRDLHQYPEIGWTEFRTTAKVVEYVEDDELKAELGHDVILPTAALGYPKDEELMGHRFRAISQGANREIIRRIEEKGGYTGAMFTIDSGKEGPTVALRFDMDCMAVPEPHDRKHFPYSMDFDSRNEGLMHACGHDGHTAMGMVFAKILQENRKLLKGKIKIIFQPAEEGVKGAYAMVQKGITDDVDAVFGMHIYPAESSSPALAGTQTGLYATRKWDVKFHGKTAHAGGAPEEGNNAILAAVNSISAMNGFLQDGRGLSRLNVGTIQGGPGRNAIPDYCEFQAESRGSETEVEERVFEKASKCVNACAEMFGCEAEIEICGMSPAGGGDEKKAAQLAELAGKLIPELKATAPVQVNTGTSDDFCFMIERVKANGGWGCYMALQSKLAAGLHNTYYDFDESALAVGVKSCIAALHLAGTI